MSQMWKISDAATIGLHTMVLLAANRECLIRTREIAALLRVSEAHLSKVLQRLTKVGLVRAVRGPEGGFALARSPEEITLLMVYEAIDGPFLLSDCLFEQRICRGERCIVGGFLKEVNGRIKNYLASTPLAELVNVYEGMEKHAPPKRKRT